MFNAPFKKHCDQVMNKAIWFILTIILYITFHYLIDIFALSSVAKIKITTESSHNEPIQIYYSSRFSKNTFSEKRSKKSTWNTAEGKSTHVVYPNNRIVRGLRVDPMKNEGEVKIYSIQLLSHFGDRLFFNADRISTYFMPNNAVLLNEEGEFVKLTSTASDPQLVLTRPVQFNNYKLSFILPIFLSLFTALVIKHVHPRQIYAVKDITSKQPSTAQNIAALDGLRGFAALLVIADHTGYEYFKGLGAVGVWIFFCLSGFLLSIPFVKNPSLIASNSYLQHYAMRRIKRIVPMYYFVLTIVFFFKGNLENFVRHLIFIQGDGIYWSIPQEMFFYLILPLIFILNYLVCRGNVKYMLISTMVMAVLLNHYFTADWLTMYGNGRQLALVPEVFILGIALSYFYHSPYAGRITNRSRFLHDLFGLVILGVVLLSSNGFLTSFFNKGVNYSWNSEVFGYVAALLLLFTISHKNSVLNRLMSSLPLRAVGIVGFSFYLIHPGVLGAIKTIFIGLTGQKLEPIVLLPVGIAITYFISVITYSLIERPFMQKTQ